MQKKYFKIVRKRNNAKRTEYNRKYRIANKEKHLEWQKQNYEKNRNKRMKSAKTWRQTKSGTIRMMHLSAKTRAENKNVKYSLSVDLIKCLIKIQRDRCKLTGINFIYENSEEYLYRPFAPSIDRIDSKKGYVCENVQIVCCIVNKAKNEYDISLFDEMCKARVELLNG